MYGEADVVLLSDAILHWDDKGIFAATEKGKPLPAAERRMLDLILDGPWTIQELALRPCGGGMGKDALELAKDLLENVVSPASLLALSRVAPTEANHTGLISLGASFPGHARDVAAKLRSGGCSLTVLAREPARLRGKRVRYLTLAGLKEQGRCDSVRQFVQLVRFLARRVAPHLVFAHSSDALPFCDVVRHLRHLHTL